MLLVVANAYSADAVTAQSYLQKLNKQFKKYNNPVKSPNTWKPKIIGVDTKYDGRNKDWASVVSACRSAVQYERRLGNFIIRAAFHDSLAVDVRACANGNDANPACDGASSGLFLSKDEMWRPENSYDKFSAIAARVLKKIASFYDVSVSDTMAVCGAVAIEELSNNRVKILATGDLTVGRLDTYMPSPPNQLPPDNADAKSFNAWWKARGFTVRQAIALMGSHALIDDQGCIKGKPKDGKCDPSDKSCIPRMFKWENHWFQEACTPTVSFSSSPPEVPKLVTEMGPNELAEFKREESCKFTSQWGKQSFNTELALQLTGQSTEVDPPPKQSIDWTNKGCKKGQQWGTDPDYCPHSKKWHYTINDAYNARACQGKGGVEVEPNRQAMRAFLDTKAWDAELIPAYILMVSKYADYNTKNPKNILKIDGTECKRFILDAKCALNNILAVKNLTDLSCMACKSGKGKCPPCCRCSTLFKDGYALADALTTKPEEGPALATVEVDELEALGVDDPVEVEPPEDPAEFEAVEFDETL